MEFSYWERTSWLRDIDFLIIGAGLTGLQTAIALKEKHPKSKVVVTERSSWSQGASLKNAGFACFANAGELVDDLRFRSQDEVFQTVRQRYDGLKYLEEKYGAGNLGLVRKGSNEFFDKNNSSDLMKCIDSLRSYNSMLYDITGEDQVFQYSSRSPIEGFNGVITNKLEGQLDSGKLYETLFGHAQSLGVIILGGLELSTYNSGDKVKAQFGSFELSCKQLFICTNAFASQWVKNEIVPARGQVICTEPINFEYQGLGMYDKGFYYWREVDGRILLGGARNLDKRSEETHEFGPNENILQELKNFLFSKILKKEVSIDYQWSGIMGMSGTGAKSPIVRSIDQGVYVAARLGGMGVALSAVVAKELVALLD